MGKYPTLGAGEVNFEAFAFFLWSLGDRPANMHAGLKIGALAGLRKFSQIYQGPNWLTTTIGGVGF